MPMTPQECLSRMCELWRQAVDADRVRRTQRRHAAAFAFAETDYVPLRFGAAVTDLNDWPEYDWAEQFHDPVKSLYMQMRGLLGFVRSGCDQLPSVRPDMGVVNCMSVMGAGYVVPEHTKPVVNAYVPKEQLAAFEVPEDISGLGTLPRVREHMEHHLSALAEKGLGGLVHVHHCDQQGPFDIAAQARGHEIFIDLYEDPDFVHGLMRKSTEVYVAVSKFCKSINGEPLNAGSACGFWMENGGLRMCADSDVLISPELWEQFVLPYQIQAFEPFGGGWVHYCGGVEGFKRPEGLHLHDLMARNPYVRALNWTTAHDWLAEMAKLFELGIAHQGGLPRRKDEDLESYFRRVFSAYPRPTGLLFDARSVAPEEEPVAMDVWHRVQDDLYGEPGSPRRAALAGAGG